MNNKKYNGVNAFTFPEMAVTLVIVSVIYIGMMFMYGEIAKQMEQEDLIDSVRDSIYIAVDEIVYEMQQACNVNIDRSGFMGMFMITITGFDDKNNNGIGGCGFSAANSVDIGEGYQVIYSSIPDEGIYKNNKPMDLYGNKYIGDSGAYILTIENFRCEDATETPIGEENIYNLSNDLQSYLSVLEIDFKLKSKIGSFERDYSVKRTIFSMNRLVKENIGDA
tara:strand:- start:29 stop:694 length:666 start_codon:yes stop_codon:yes gene_type:complete